jgi:Asp-tRNA(Asn)/Glu-tRNA(Gln) amidotransferase A subunit family amidase
MALTYSIIAGADSNDNNSLLQPVVSLKDYNKYQDLSDLKKMKANFLHYTRLLMQIFGHIETSDYIRAQQLRTRAIQEFQAIFKKVDLIMTPTTAMLSPEISKSALKYGMANTYLTGKAMKFVSIANFVSVPAVSVPSGNHQDLPMGLQFIGSWWNEALLLRMAKACERLSGNERGRPGEHWYSNEIL